MAATTRGVLPARVLLRDLRQFSWRNGLCTVSTVMAKDPLLVTEDAYLKVLLPLLDHAKESVDILAYSFAIGSAAGKLASTSAVFQVAQKLVEISPKVKVRLYIEGERETWERNAVTVRYLKKNGRRIQVKAGATHAKGFCIDGRFVLFGSTNLTNQSITKNNETNVLIDDRKTAERFLDYFTHLWKGGRHGGIKLRDPFWADGEFKNRLVKMIDGAKRKIEFSIYFFDQRDIEAALVRAHERGVEVTGFVHNHFAFAMSYVRRTRATVKRLQAAGIKGLHYGPVHLFTHSKYLICDRKEIALGTGNWLNEDVHIHPQLYIHLKNPKLAAKLARHMRGQIAALS